MGAWIEIIYVGIIMACLSVAPLVGAWIEISSVKRGFYPLIVAPLVGAWIEIMQIQKLAKSGLSRSPRGSVD